MATKPEFRIVVATDGSAHARGAVAASMAFPWPARSSVRIVVARRPSVGEAEWPAPVWAALESGFDQVAADARRVLSRRWPSADVVMVDRPAVPAILAEAATADAVVVGSRGLGAVGRAVLGSVSRGVVRSATCPTLVVKSGRSQRVTSLAIGLDGSTNSRRAVAFVAGLDPPRGGRVTLVAVVERLRARSLGLMPASVRATLAQELTAVNEERETSARRELEWAAGTLEKAGWRTSIAVRSGTPLEELLAAANAARAQVIVVGARGTGGVERLLLGSVAEGVLNRSPLSTLIVR